MINWTTGNSLTLVADVGIVVSGTIQHDSPATGVAVGSRHGLTSVEGTNVRLLAGQNIYYSISTNMIVALGGTYNGYFAQVGHGGLVEPNFIGDGTFGGRQLWSPGRISTFGAS